MSALSTTTLMQRQSARKALVDMIEGNSNPDPNVIQAAALLLQDIAIEEAS